MSVENRSRPISTGKTGVMVPCIMASTAIGKAGVDVDALVGVAAGDGVITKKVAVFSGGAGVLVAEPVASGEADGETFVLGAAVGTGAAGLSVGWFKNNKTTATNTEMTPNIMDQRALTTYLCRTR
jgi:hypothetical protein